MANTFGLNGKAPPDSTEIGWEGIDIPEHAKTYVYPLSRMRDSLRKAARIPEGGVDFQNLASIAKSKGLPESPSQGELTRPFAGLLSKFRAEVAPLVAEPDTIGKRS